MADPPKSDVIRAIVINTINMLIILSTETIYNSTEDYLQLLLKTAMEGSVEVRKRSVQGITTILDFRLELVVKHYEAVFEVLIACLNERDQEIALAAAEFWSGLAINQMEDDEGEYHRREIINKVLPILGPILLESCRYAKADQIASLPSNKNDLNIYKDKYYETEGVGEDVDDDEDDEYGQLESMGTLRRASAFAFEHLAKVSGEATFNSIKDTLENYLQNADDHQGREAAILVLGAIADEAGSYEYIQPFLPILVPLLFKYLDDSYPKIKSITCWTLSKFSPWLSTQPVEEVQIYIEKLCSLMLDSDTELQEASCTAVAEMLECSDEKSGVNIEPILQTYGQVCPVYQGNCLLALLDMLGCLVKGYKDQVNHEGVVEMVITPLTTKWNEIADNDRIICPLFQCFQYVAEVIGNNITPYAPTIIDR